MNPLISEKRQQDTQARYYAEAMRYMDEASETLKRANKKGHFYQNPKYVRIACGTAYRGVLHALDAYLMRKGMKRGNGRKFDKYYKESLEATNRRLLLRFSTVHEVLHLAGYHDGLQDARVVKIGFNTAYDIIERIKPL
jgi:uncharacterized protein (UPF0332 family)